MFGGLNTYVYVGAKPLNWIDPFGLCSCVAKGINGIGDKKSEFIVKWYGNKRNITCTYECTNQNGKKESVRGTHTETYIFQWSKLSDRGDEGDCKGAIFKAMYSATQKREILSRTHFKSFPPAGSDVPELEEWAKENCNGVACNK